MDFDLMRKRLVEAREFMGYNRKDFATELKIPYRTITNYENGSREPGGDYITQVADFCGVTTDWLLGLTDNARSSSPYLSQHFGPEIEHLVNICSLLTNPALKKVIEYAEDLNYNPNNRKKPTPVSEDGLEEIFTRYLGELNPGQQQMLLDQLQSMTGQQKEPLLASAQQITGETVP